MNADRENEIRFYLRVTAERETKDHPTYFCVSGDTDPADAEQQFIRKFGKQPAETFNQFGNIWLGPVEAK